MTDEPRPHPARRHRRRARLGQRPAPLRGRLHHRHGRLARLGRRCPATCTCSHTRSSSAPSGLMLFIEFFVDKIPGLDSVWDAIHTFVRIPAGAALAGGGVRRRPGELGDGGGADGRHARGDQPRRQADDARLGQHLARAVLEHRPVAPRRRRRAVHALAVVGRIRWSRWSCWRRWSSSRWSSSGCCGASSPG